MEKKTRKERIRDAYYKVSAKVTGGIFLTSAALVGSSGMAYADKFSKAAEDAAKGIQSSAEGVVKWLILIILVILGLTFMIGTQQQKEQAKAGIAWKIIGAALVVGAVSMSGIIFDWF